MGYRSISPAAKASVVICASAWMALVPAHAGTKVGWLLANQPDASSAYTRTPAYAYNSTGGAMTVTPIAAGFYQVDFEKAL